MATTSGDIATKQDGLMGGGKGKDMKTFLKGIKKINDERTARYHKLIGRPAEEERSNVIRRVNPK